MKGFSFFLFGIYDNKEESLLVGQNMCKDNT